MVDAEPHEPARHYGHSSYRPDFTACGKENALVTVTFLPDQVTCRVCVEEMQIQGNNVAYRAQS